MHDRVQQAAYALIPEAEKKQVHLQVGRLLLKNTSYNELKENIFDIINQLNEGIELITEQTERDTLAKLNLEAAKKAKASTAYEQAIKYLEIGLELLSLDSWDLQYNLSLEIHVELLLILCLNAQFERVIKLSKNILKKTKYSIDKIKIYQIIIMYHFATLKPKKAIDTAIKALAEIGIYLPQKESENEREIENRIKQENKSIKYLLKDKEIEDLANLPTMTDPYKLAAINILQQIMTAAVTTNLSLFIEVTSKQFLLCIKYGNSSQSAATYSIYGAMMCGVINNINSGYKFGKLSIKLQQKYRIAKLEP